MERATIRAEQYSRSRGFTIWQFQLVSLSGDILAISEQFKSGSDRPARNPVTIAAWEEFGRQLRADGWVLVGTAANQKTWWEVPLARGAREDIDSEILRLKSGAAWSSPAPAPRSGPSCAIWSMWGITLLVIVGLFVICVVLVFTSEIRFGPA